jgi:hypothetical protein
MFTTEQKSQLAKLLATENLTIQHQKINTAKFDPQNRTLYLPIWQDMTNSLYDLLVGHEVGHALYTPPDGWHDAVTGPKTSKNYKHFLNVVEDARIEKKVQRKYPGLKKQFVLAYKDLIDRDFFGTKGLDINVLSFIDRLNIFSKSQWTNNNIRFSEKEKGIVEEVRSTETWEDVLRITEVIFEYSKEEQKEIKTKQFEQMVSNNDDQEDYDYEDGDDDNLGDDIESNDEESEENESNDETQNEDSTSSEKNENEISTINRFKESQSSFIEDEDFEPVCQTDESFRSNETSLVDIESKNVEYLNIPKPDLEKIITPAKRVHELNDIQLKSYIEIGFISPDLPLKLLQEFKNRNDKYIGLLAKEFEMHKAAKSYNKSKISDTGDIDINKLSSYKFDENIFRKMTIVPKGKSHGIVLLLDKSGSMAENMAGSIEQILVLTMFCRKVNIPFIMYGFGGSYSVKMIDVNEANLEAKCFSKNKNDIAFSNVYLREYLNSNMSNAEFTRAIKHMLLIKKSYEKSSVRIDEKLVPRYRTEQLYNTPLTEAIVATAEIIKDFKKKNNLDITNLVIVHDGDSDSNKRHYTDNDDMIYIGNETNYYLQDIKNRYVNKINLEYDSVYKLILDWFNKTTDSKIFGFFICNSRYKRYVKEAIELRYYVDGVSVQNLKYKNYTQYDAIMKDKLKELKNNKFLESRSPGFESFFLISGGDDLNIDNESLEIEGKVTTKNLVRAFTKLNKKKSVNRVLVSRFIQGIAV